MDHSKIGLAHFINISPMKVVDTVVTDSADPQLAEWLANSDVELIVAG